MHHGGVGREHLLSGQSEPGFSCMLFLIHAAALCSRDYYLDFYFFKYIMHEYDFFFKSNTTKVLITKNSNPCSRHPCLPVLAHTETFQLL